MRRTLILLLIVFFGFLALPLAAQEDGELPAETDPDSPPIESDWDAYTPELYSRGDKTFNINLGIILPTVFTGPGMEGNSHNLGIGGAGSLSFNYFLNSYFFWGGELSGMFSGTRGKNMYYAVPFGLHIGYQLLLGRFEFPISLMVGAAPQKYLEKGYFGFIVKPAVSGFFRFNPDWSFGVNAKWWMLPQWPKNGKDALGNFLEITLAARYHF